MATPDVPSDDVVPSLLALSDAMGTGWFAADAANVTPGSTVVVVGEGAVGLLGVLSAKHMGAERIIAMSRHESRQKLAREFGATDIVTERGDEGVVRIKELTNGAGADSVLECVGTQESMMQAIRVTRPGGSVGYVGVPHGVALDGEKLFYGHVHLHGGPAPVRRFLPELIDLVWKGKINPGKVFDLTLPLDQVAAAASVRGPHPQEVMEDGAQNDPLLATDLIRHKMISSKTKGNNRSTEMEIKRIGSQPSTKGPSEWFTGTVRIDPLFQAPAPALVQGASVTFEPGARTAWHKHPLGQTLIVTAGYGWVQRAGGLIEEIRPGDVVWFSPGEKHWHGATPTTAVTHIAIQENLNGKVVDWMEQVSNEQYRK